MGSGISNTARQVGLATGIAGWGAIFESGIASRLPDSAPDGAAQGIASTGTRAAEQAGPQAVDAAREAFIGSINELFLLAALVAFAGAALGLALTRERDMVSHGEGAPEQSQAEPAAA
jgi:hypothetical protein